MSQYIEIVLGTLRATVKVTEVGTPWISRTLESAQPLVNLLTAIAAVTAIVVTVKSRQTDKADQAKEHQRRYYVLLVLNPISGLVNSFSHRFDYLIEAHQQALLEPEHALNETVIKQLHIRFDNDFNDLATVIQQCYGSWNDITLRKELEDALDGFEDQLTAHIEKLSHADPRTSPGDIQGWIRILMVRFVHIIRDHDPVSEQDQSIVSHLRFWQRKNRPGRGSE